MSFETRPWKLPMGLYVSSENYKSVDRGEVVLWAKDSTGFWYENGKPVRVDQVPDDLWPIRPVQR